MNNLRDNKDGTCNCRPFGGGCFFTDGFDGPCDCKCHQAPIPVDGWEKKFDEGFVWEEASKGMFALFRVCNEADNSEGSFDFRGSRTLANPAYVKAFIHQLLKAERERLVKVVKGMEIKNAHGVRIDGYNSALQAVLKELGE